MRRIWCALVLSAAVLVPVCAGQAVALPEGDLVISEVFYSRLEDLVDPDHFELQFDFGRFIEVLNASNRPIDLSNYSLWINRGWRGDEETDCWFWVIPPCDEEAPEGTHDITWVLPEVELRPGHYFVLTDSPLIAAEMESRFVPYMEVEEGSLSRYLPAVINAHTRWIDMAIREDDDRAVDFLHILPPDDLYPAGGVSLRDGFLYFSSMQRKNPYLSGDGPDSWETCGTEYDFRLVDPQLNGMHLIAATPGYCPLSHTAWRDDPPHFPSVSPTAQNLRGLVPPIAIDDIGDLTGIMPREGAFILPRGEELGIVEFSVEPSRTGHHDLVGVSDIEVWTEEGEVPGDQGCAGDFCAEVFNDDNPVRERSFRIRLTWAPLQNNRGGERIVSFRVTDDLGDVYVGSYWFLAEIGAGRCPTQQVLGAENQKIKVIRRFRDEFMYRSTEGLWLIKLYDRFSFEIGKILLKKPLLVKQTFYFLEGVTGDLERMEKYGSPKLSPLDTANLKLVTPETIESGLKLIAAFSEFASPELEKELKKLEYDILKGMKGTPY